MPSSGRTPGPTRSSTSSPATAARIDSGRRSGCRWRPTSPGPKVKWILDNVDGARASAENGDLLFGNIDTWCIWNLTGGIEGGVHVTDVTNASRTMLMNLETLDWDDEILQLMGIPRAMLPTIRSSSDVYGKGVGDLTGVPIAGDLGDQQAALFGQTCFSAGEAKNTYGTGNFMLLNTGTKMVPSKQGLLTTVGYKIGDQAAVYALEGSIAITGALVQWLRDNLGLINTSADVEKLAATVEDNGGVYFVPAFSGLFAPYWRNDARGVIAGLTRYVNKGHIARATLEATAWQTREVLDAMNADSGVPLTALKVDGGMVYNELLMQFQSDVLNVPVIRPKVAETTALGAAYAAGLAVGFWDAVEDLRANWAKDKEWTPSMDDATRERSIDSGRRPSRGPSTGSSPKLVSRCTPDRVVGASIRGGRRRDHWSRRRHPAMTAVEAVDVLIVGGGATGAGIVRDLARRGLRCLLVEKGDLGTGTSGRYHGLLHSGGRYVVEDAPAARECIAENHVLRRIAPACIEDTGGWFVSTPDDPEDYVDRFAERLC